MSDHINEKMDAKEREFFRHVSKYVHPKLNGVPTKDIAENQELKDNGYSIFDNGESSVRAVFKTESTRVSICFVQTIDLQSSFAALSSKAVGNDDFKAIEDAIIEHLKACLNKYPDITNIDISGHSLGSALTQYMVEAILRRRNEEPLNKIKNISAFCKSSPKISSEVVENAEKICSEGGNIDIPKVEILYQDTVFKTKNPEATYNDQVITMGEERLFSSKKSKPDAPGEKSYQFDTTKVSAYRRIIECTFDQELPENSTGIKQRFGYGDLHNARSSYLKNYGPNQPKVEIKIQSTTGSHEELNINVTPRTLTKKLGFFMLRGIANAYVKPYRTLFVSKKRRDREQQNIAQEALNPQPRQEPSSTTTQNSATASKSTPAHTKKEKLEIKPDEKKNKMLFQQSSKPKKEPSEPTKPDLDLNSKH